MSTAVELTHPQLGFIRKYVFSTDHKVIAIQYIITASAMAVVGGILSMLMRLQLAWPSEQYPILGDIFPTGFAGGIMRRNSISLWSRCTAPSWCSSCSQPS